MIINKLFEEKVNERCELVEQLEWLLEERAVWYSRGAARFWRVRARWLIGELRSLDRELDQLHAGWFWGRVIKAAL